MEVTPEIARIHAHICGDGYVYLSKEKRSPADLRVHKRIDIEKPTWVLAYCNTCEHLINEFRSDFIKTFNRHGSYIKKKFELRLKGTKNIIKNLELEGKNSRTWCIPDFIIKSSPEIKANWIKAFFDDEACVDLKKKAILVETVNKEGMKQINDVLISLGIENKFYHIRSKNTWRIALYRDNVIKYGKLISSSHPEKKDKLEKIMGWVGVS